MKLFQLSPKRTVADPESSPEITHLWCRGTQEEWLRAMERYDSLVVDPELEAYMSTLDWRTVERMTVEEFYNFLHDKYYVWRHEAPNRLSAARGYLRKHCRYDELAELQEIKDMIFSLDRDNISLMLRTAERIRGMGTAGASGLLGFLFPDKYGIIDQFVVITLRKIEGLPEHGALHKMSAAGLRTNEGILLERLMRNKAAELNLRFQTDFWTPRKVDMVLWAYRR